MVSERYPGLVWVRDKTTGNRHRWPTSEAEEDDNLEVLNVPIDDQLSVRPEKTPAYSKKADAADNENKGL